MPAEDHRPDASPQENDALRRRLAEMEAALAAREAQWLRFTQQQRELLEIARSLGSSLDLQEVLTRIAASARSMLRAAGSTIYLLSADGRTLFPQVAIEPPYEAEILAAPLEVASSFTGQAILARKGLIFNDAFHSPLGQQIPNTPLDEDERVIVVPLIVDGEALGGMCLTRYGTLFTPEDLTLAETLAAYAAAVLKNARIYEALQREAQERHDAEERYRLLFDRVPVGLYRTTPEGRILDANLTLVQMLGYPDRQALLGADVMDLYVEPEKRARERALLARDGVVHHYVLRLRRYDGSILWVEDHARALRNAEGEILFFEGSLADLTERKRAEEALHQSEQRFREMFNTMSSGAAVYEALDDGRDFLIVDFNPAAERMKGVRKHEILGRRLTEVFPGVEEFGLLDVLRRVWRTGQPEMLPARLYRDARHEGWRENRVYKLPSGEVVAIYDDVTERKQAEEALHKSQERLHEAQKLESIGRLAGGVAHEFNNLLAIINGYSELLLRTLEENSPLREDVADILKAGRRAAELTRQLLTFSQQRPARPQPLDLNHVLQGMVKMLARIIGEDIILRLELAPDLGLVQADPRQIEEVVMNLVVNARDAMPTGGVLTLRTANVAGQTCREAYGLRAPKGPCVLLSISDTGCGMNAEVKAHLFEPFFTTKEVGKGTGLGLATVYGIVQQLAGSIQVVSEVNQGATFTILLPRITGQAPPPPTESPAVEALPRGSERLLVVEDDPGVRQMMVRLLSGLGYAVQEAANPTEALELCAQDPGPFQLILVDVVMPQMSGLALVERLLRLRPTSQVLYMSGHAEEAIKRHGGLQPGLGLLEKPFTLEQLARRVREVLDGSLNHPAA